MSILKTNIMRRVKYDDSKGIATVFRRVIIVDIKKITLVERYKLSMIVNERLFEELPLTPIKT